MSAPAPSDGAASTLTATSVDGTPWSRRARTLLLAGPAVFAVLLAVRSVRPSVDLVLLTIAAAMVAVMVPLARGARWSAALFLVFPVALVVSPAARDLSFSLTAYDSAWWRAHAIASLLAAGSSVATSLLVVARRPDTAAGQLGVTAGGLAIGLGMIGLVQLVAPQPADGRHLSEEERAAAQAVALVDTAFAPAELRVDGAVPIRLVNTGGLPHTMTIDELDLDVYVPAGRETIAIVDTGRLDPGVYEIYCSIGDHRALGMVGVLTVP